MQETIDIKKYSSFVETNSFVKKTGKISRIIGLMIESDGPGVAIGCICTIQSRTRPPIEAQVVGFRDNQTLLMPLGDIYGIEPGLHHRSNRRTTVFWCKLGNDWTCFRRKW